MICRSIKGFTLVELLVVISILGVLAAALTTQVTSAREAARAMKCKTNLKNLAQAALAYAVDDHPDIEGVYYAPRAMPWAGSHEGSWPGGPSVSYAPMYHHRPGWVSWTWSVGGFPWPNRNPQSGSVKPACFHGSSSVTYHSLSNGVLWEYAGGDLDTYVCDQHKKVCRQKGVHRLTAPIRRSYVMNAYFGYDYRPGGLLQAKDRAIGVDSLSSRGNAGSLLLFAELPAYRVDGGKFVESISTEMKASDGVLDVQISQGYNGNPPGEEVIGFNHKVAKRHVAHVAFADGHVDGVVAPDKPSDRALSKLQDLTCLLCNGVDLPADPDAWSSARSDHVK